VNLDSESATDNITTAFLGIHNDPIFGKTSAACAFELRTPLSWQFKDVSDIVIDSVDFHLSYSRKSSMYDTITKQKINVYRLDKSLVSPDGNVLKKFSDLGDSYKGDLLASKYINHQSIDTTIIKTKDADGTITKIDTLTSGTIKFKFNNPSTFGRPFVENTNIYTSQESFLEFFKGIYVEAEDSPNNGGLFAFNLISERSLRIWYHLKSEEGELDDYGNKKKYYFWFNVNKNSRRLSNFTHTHEDNVVGSTDKIYVQGAAGLRANLKVNNFDEIAAWAGLKDKEINRAEMVFKLDESVDTDKFPVPEKLVMVGFNKDNEIVALTDYYVANNFLNGFYNKDKKEYRFNIAYLLQTLVNLKNDDSENGFYGYTKIDLSKGFAIYPDNRRENPRRVILDGKSIKLNMTYTEL